MKYQEFLDHLLGVYYHISNANPKIGLTPFWVVDMIQEGYTSSDVKDILNSLGAQGYLLHYYQGSGDISKITPSGKMYYENLPSEYRVKIESFLEERGIMKMVRKLGVGTTTDEINKNHPQKLIDEIEFDLIKMDGIDKDVIEDLKIINIEFQKRSPNKEILRIKIDDLLDENILFDKVQELKYRLSL